MTAETAALLGQYNQAHQGGVQGEPAPVRILPAGRIPARGMCDAHLRIVLQRLNRRRFELADFHRKFSRGAVADIIIFCQLPRSALSCEYFCRSLIN